MKGAAAVPEKNTNAESRSMISTMGTSQNFLFDFKNNQNSRIKL